MLNFFKKNITRIVVSFFIIVYSVFYLLIPVIKSMSESVWYGLFPGVYWISIILTTLVLLTVIFILYIKKRAVIQYIAITAFIVFLGLIFYNIKHLNIKANRPEWRLKKETSPFVSTDTVFKTYNEVILFLRNKQLVINKRNILTDWLYTTAIVPESYLITDKKINVHKKSSTYKKVTIFHPLYRKKILVNIDVNAKKKNIFLDKNNNIFHLTDWRQANKKKNF